MIIATNITQNYTHNNNNNNNNDDGHNDENDIILIFCYACKSKTI